MGWRQTVGVACLLVGCVAGSGRQDEPAPATDDSGVADTDVADTDVADTDVADTDEVDTDPVDTDAAADTDVDDTDRSVDTGGDTDAAVDTDGRDSGARDTDGSVDTDQDTGRPARVCESGSMDTAPVCCEQFVAACQARGHTGCASVCND